MDVQIKQNSKMKKRINYDNDEAFLSSRWQADEWTRQNISMFLTFNPIRNLEEETISNSTHHLKGWWGHCYSNQIQLEECPAKISQENNQVLALRQTDAATQRP